MYSGLISIVVLALALFQHATAFSSSTSPNRPMKSQLALQAMSGRRAFVGAVIASTILASPVFAEEGTVDDLSMPTANEQKDEDAAMAERLRKKAELKKKMARPTNYLDSLKNEQEKKKERQMTQEERRNALCEELGRGC